MHVAGHNCVHLVATISQSINLMLLYFETYESLRPSQCAVGPLAKSEQGQCMVTTCSVTPVEGLLGLVPSYADLPPWSLNALYAKHGRSHDEDILS